MHSKHMAVLVRLCGASLQHHLQPWVASLAVSEQAVQFLRADLGRPFHVCTHLVTLPPKMSDVSIRRTVKTTYNFALIESFVRKTPIPVLMST